MLLKKLVRFQRKRIYRSIPINRLYRERLLFLGQHVDDEIANQLIGIMMYLNGEDESKDMYLYINSPGGAVLAGISVYDAMQFVVPDVHTICMGLAASMGSFILTGGEITKRIALPHALRQCFFLLDQGRNVCAEREVIVA
jgi:ATP-dependent Clp protease protease subunit